MTADPVAAVLARYGLDGANVQEIKTGLINRTYRITSPDGSQYALQCVNPIFPPGTTENIAIVTSHLENRGLPTPRLRETLEGELSVRLNTQTWRLLTWIDGDVQITLDRPELAREAGRLLGQFHVALSDLPADLQNPRTGIHDTRAHLRSLERALAGFSDRPELARVVALGRDILSAADDLQELPATGKRLVHGDPKISNVIFDGKTGQALCLIDLDTLANMPLPLELGDAFRSWCNPSGEDTRETHFAPELFEAALKGYAEPTRNWITRPESDAIVAATHGIYLELAARFCVDAMREDYFGWNPDLFTSHREHSEVRAAGQLAAARSLQSQRALLENLILEAF